jgi:hypothetical protein
LSLSAGKQSGFGSIVSGGILQIVSGEIACASRQVAYRRGRDHASGVTHWLWRAIDADGNVLDILVQPRRKAKAARRFMGA